MPTWIVDESNYRKLELVKNYLFGDDTSLTVDKRRDLANMMSDVLSSIEEVPDSMTDEELALAEEECKRGDGMNYRKYEWDRWLKEVRAKHNMLSE